MNGNNANVKRWLKILLFAMIYCTASTPTVQAEPIEARLSFQSEPGDYIGQGEFVAFTEQDATFDAVISEDHRVLSVSVFSIYGSYWYLELAAPFGESLQSGVYEGAVRSVIQGPTEPGMDFYGDGRGCSMLSGSFTILDASFGQRGYVERLEATFEQHCEDAEPGLFGEILIINPPPPPPLQVIFTIDEKGVIQRESGSATISGTIKCSVDLTVSIGGTINQRASRFVLAQTYFYQFLECSPTQDIWTAQAIPNTVPLNPGPAEVKVFIYGYDPNTGQDIGVNYSDYIHLIGKKGTRR